MMSRFGENLATLHLYHTRRLSQIHNIIILYETVLLYCYLQPVDKFSDGTVTFFSYVVQILAFRHMSVICIRQMRFVGPHDINERTQNIGGSQPSGYEF